MLNALAQHGKTKEPERTCKPQRKRRETDEHQLRDETNLNKYFGVGAQGGAQSNLKNCDVMCWAMV